MEISWFCCNKNHNVIWLESWSRRQLDRSFLRKISGVPENQYLLNYLYFDISEDIFSFYIHDVGHDRELRIILLIFEKFRSGLKI